MPAKLTKPSQYMIEDPVAIHFANDRIRATADQIARSYYVLKSLINDWNYRNIANVLPPGDNTVVDDGAATDGRSPITADDCYSIILRAQDIVTMLEADNNAKLAAVLRVANHPI